MRRGVRAFIAVSTGVIGTVMVPSSAYSAPSPSPSLNVSPAAGSGTPVCRITDSRVTEVSGLVATATGYVVINDSNLEQSRQKVFFLDASCRVSNQISYPRPTRDPEDLAVGKDGTIWVADIGDNSQVTGGSGNRRTTIALLTIAPNSKDPVVHRFSYPDGK